MTSIFWISWLVRKPSWKWMKGTRVLMVVRWATAARSMTSCTLPVDIMVTPVVRQLMTS